MMMMVPTEMGVEETVEMGEMAPEVRSRRQKRFVEFQSLNEVYSYKMFYWYQFFFEYFLFYFSKINELSRKVLKSIEVALIASEDNGNCLKRVLCENNKSTNNETSNQKIWMPVWR